jgi:hypothetical protein
MTNKKLFVIFTCVFFAFIVLAIILSNIQPDERIAIVTVDGKVYKEIDLSVDDTFVVETSKGTNQVSIKDNAIYIEEATCPDKLCVRHGKLNNKYDSIVCLPHKVVIEYKTASDIDAVVGR